MPIITLTSDWKQGDYYLSALKGKLASTCPEAKIIDVTHSIQAFNIIQAAFVIRNSYQHFPKGTIHIIAINTELSEKTPLLVVKKKEQYFIVSDNGMTDLMFGEKPDGVWKVKNIEQSSFNSLYIYVDVAAHILEHGSIDQFALKYEKYFSQTPLRPVIDDNLINGTVIYIDSYGNAITNISLETFNKVKKGEFFEIFIQSNHYMIDTISKNYSDAPAGELVGLFNSSNLLEIAINKGNVAELLSIDLNSVVRIKFYKNNNNELLLTGN